MTESFIINNNKKFWILSTILTILLILPVVFFGIKDQEAYQLHYFSLGFHLSSIKNFFIDYVDFYGPGTYLPTLGEDKLSVSNIFFLNTKLYFFIKFFFYITFQVFFLKKIFDFYKIDNKIFVLYFIFSISNFNYVYSDDWHTLFSYSLIFPIFYYLLLFYKFRKKIDFFFLIFFSSYQFANGHFGNIGLHYTLFLIFVLLQRDFFFIKKKYFYLGLIIFIIICFNRSYNIIFRFLEFPEGLETVTQSGYSITDIFFTQINSIFNFNLMNRSPFYGIINYVVLIYSFKILINRKSHEILYLNIYYIFLFTICFLPILENFFYISASWQSRDIMNLVSIILIGLIFKDINNPKLKFYTHIITLFFILIIFIKNNLTYVDFKKFNFISKKVEDPVLIKSFENISKTIDNKSIYKVYLSPEFDNNIRGGFKRYGIYAVTDLIKYRLFPLNGWFKYSSKDNIWPSKSQMHGFISSDYKSFNDDNFLNFFLVNKIIYFKSEADKVTINREIIDEIYLNHINRTIIIAKRLHTPLEFFNTKITCKKNSVTCILNKNYFEKNPNIIFNRIGLNKIEILNKNNQKTNFIFPFTDADNWKVYKNNNLIDKDFKKVFKFKFLELSPNTKYHLEYVNLVNFYSNIVTMFGQLILFLFVIFLYLYNNEKNLN